MKWETQAGLPSEGLLYSQITEKIRELIELLNMMGHIKKANDNELIGSGFLGIAEVMEKILHQVTKLAQGRLQ